MRSANCNRGQRSIDCNGLNAVDDRRDSRTRASPVFCLPEECCLSVRVYLLTAHELRLTTQTGPTLDAVSLRLPNGAYTTLRTYDTDRIIGLSAHLQRLIESSQMLQRPYPIDPAAIRSALHEVIAREREPALRVRLTVPLDE